MVGPDVWSTATVEVDGVQVASKPAPYGPDCAEAAWRLAVQMVKAYPGGVPVVWTRIGRTVYRSTEYGR